MKATVGAIIDGKRYGHPGRLIEVIFPDAVFAFQVIRIPEALFDLGDVNVGDPLDVNFLPERLIDEVNRALAQAQEEDAHMSRCPWCGERFVELGPGKLSHWCVEEHKGERTQ